MSSRRKPPTLDEQIAQAMMEKPPAAARRLTDMLRLAYERRELLSATTSPTERMHLIATVDRAIALLSGALDEQIKKQFKDLREILRSERGDI